MRPIDADALRAQMYHEAFETDTDMQRWDGGCWIRYKMFENAIDNATTIEPQRMRGKWIDQKGGGCCCSECGRYALDEPDGNFIHVAVKSNFCPNCGADMRWT